MRNQSVSNRVAEDATLKQLVQGAEDAAPVSGLTHKFYRYPARFSPAFVRGAIDTFTVPGDLVLDPFAGGGTTLVEAVASGRNAIGVDINTLATFISEAKTTILNDAEIETLRKWSQRLQKIIDMTLPSSRSIKYADAGYYRNLESPEYWRLRKSIEQVLTSIVRLKSKKAQTLARCILLKTSQWALDSRKTRPTVSRFRDELVVQATIMIEAAIELRERVKNKTWKKEPTATCLNRSAAGMENEREVIKQGCPKLIVTSPPYPGVHVLYHRWQVDGRKESPAPYWIANKLDGSGASYYTLGDRKCAEQRVYFENLEKIFTSIAKLCDEETVIVQMVAFSEPEWQLERYLGVMENCGLIEHFPKNLKQGNKDGRIWRDVPNRRWHAQQRSKANGAREVVLIHKRSAAQ